MAFGTGSAIAHRVVDSVMGPRVVQHEHTAVNNAGSAVVSTANSVPNSIPDSCTSQAKAFQDVKYAKPLYIAFCICFDMCYGLDGFLLY